MFVRDVWCVGWDEKYGGGGCYVVCCVEIGVFGDV